MPYNNWDHLPSAAAMGFTPFVPPPQPTGPDRRLLPPPTSPPPPPFDIPGGIDYGDPRLMRPPGPPAADIPTARSGFSPLADWAMRFGLSGENPWHQLSRWAAPGMNRVEGAGRTVRGIASEATGVPAAARAGQQFAEGDYVHGAGNALMALPGRGAGILGSLLSSTADAQTPDPRLKRIGELDAEITRREREITNLGRRTKDPDRLEILTRPHQEALTTAQTERTQIRDAMRQEANQLRLQQEADERSAMHRNTPTARAYPWSQPTTAGIGAAAGFLTPFTRARSAVTAHNTRINEIATRWEDAVGRANNTRLAARSRTQAANEARELQAEFDRVIAAAPGHGGRVGAALTGAGLTDLGVATPTIIDYLSSRGDPTGPLANYTMQSINPTNPDLWGRLGLGFLGGGVIGELGHELGSRGIERPTGHAAETATLRRQYRKGR